MGQLSHPYIADVWAWLRSQIEAGFVTLSETAYSEVGNKYPECLEWLHNKGLIVLPNTPAVLQEAVAIKASLNIIGDNYGARGVCENDLLIIASARINEATLVSNENTQANLPSELRNYKIPAVCAHLNVPVHCQSFLDYLKDSGEVFDGSHGAT